jgi:hypothetical protein
MVSYFRWYGVWSKGLRVARHTTIWTTPPAQKSFLNDTKSMSKSTKIVNAEFIKIKHFCLLKDKTRMWNSWAWCRVSVVPAIRETEVGRSHEAMSLRPAWTTQNTPLQKGKGKTTYKMVENKGFVSKNLKNFCNSVTKTTWG